MFAKTSYSIHSFTRTARALLGSFGVGAAMLLLGTVGQANAANETVLGSESCGASTCHGAITPWDGASVLQNEYITWKNQDKHSQAYKVLLSDKAKRIANNLGIGAPHRAEQCLACHTFNIPKERHGPRFTRSEGVGCEACHGAAENWLGVHMTGVRTKADRERIIGKGMYPTEDPVKRAELCLTCHMGTETNRRLNHQIQGAGHPRLSFELDTFTAVQPAHYVIDRDYYTRKEVANGVKVWAVGQAIALKRRAAAIADPRRNRMGVFPEFTNFDCHSCHHPLEKPRYERTAGDGGPGVPRVNTSNLTMLRIAVSAVDPALGQELKTKGQALHRSGTQGVEAMETAAKNLSRTAHAAAQKVAGAKFGSTQMLSLLKTLTKEARAGNFNSFATAEQASMAFGAVIAAMGDGGYLTNDAYDKLDAALGDLFQTVENPANYSPTRFRSAVNKIKAATPASL